MRDDKELFNDSYDPNEIKLDVDLPVPLKPISSLPTDFQIRTVPDITLLEHFVADNYTLGLRLYRGHESQDYKLESTIVRLVKSKNKNCSIDDVVNAEKKANDLFCARIFDRNNRWLCHKLASANEDLFKLSIGRHLGLPCRLIDVTASLETAIWFAVMNPQYYNKDGKLILIVLDKKKIAKKVGFPSNSTGLSFAHEPFVTDDFNDLPLGEQRRFIQNGSFIWVDNKSLFNEQQVIEDSALVLKQFIIPHDAKLTLASYLYRDIYSGFAYQSDIEKIKEEIMK